MVRSDSVEMSAIPGLAIDSSAKGWSASTTTARFMGTLSALDADPFMMRRVSAFASGMAMMQSDTPSSPAEIAVLKLM